MWGCSKMCHLYLGPPPLMPRQRHARARCARCAAARTCAQEQAYTAVRQPLAGHFHSNPRTPTRVLLASVAYLVQAGQQQQEVAARRGLQLVDLCLDRREPHALGRPARSQQDAQSGWGLEGRRGPGSSHSGGDGEAQHPEGRDERHGRLAQNRAAGGAHELRGRRGSRQRARQQG